MDWGRSPAAVLMGWRMSERGVGYRRWDVSVEKRNESVGRRETQVRAPLPVTKLQALCFSLLNKTDGPEMMPLGCHV